MSTTQHEAIEQADRLKERYGATVPTSQAAAMLRQQHALIVQMAEALDELADLMDFTRSGNYTPDSFTTQPARNALAAAKDYLK